MLAMCAIKDVPITPEIPDEAIRFRQLRHHARNALQRVIGHILEAPALCRTREGRRAADDLVRRVELSAEISDALFGLTRTPQPLPERLRALTDNLVALYTDGLQCVEIEIVASVRLQSPSRDTLIVQIVHELVVNALKHGLRMRLLGKIVIHVIDRPGGGTLLTVTNDGWRMQQQVCAGEGLHLVTELARRTGGEVDIATLPATKFQIKLPPERPQSIGLFGQPMI